jgi:hypothetical protein
MKTQGCTKHMAFKIESQVASRIVTKTFLTSCTQDELVQKANTSKHMYFVLKIHLHVNKAYQGGEAHANSLVKALTTAPLSQVAVPKTVTAPKTNIICRLS